MNKEIAIPLAAEPIAAPVRPSGSSFYIAMKLLPAPRRDAMYEIYGFCRAVDDIADGDAPHPQRRADLQLWRGDIDDIYRGAAPARLAGLAQCVGRFDLQREDFLAVIDGMAMDVEQDIRAPDLATLDLYCDRVAQRRGPALGARLRHGTCRRRAPGPSSGPSLATDQHSARPG